MKVLIFGINGQDGYYLNQLMTKMNIDVIGISHKKNNWISGDVGNFIFVEELIKKYQPEYIFHFAAVSTTQHSALFDNHNAISTGTLNILEAVKIHSRKSKIFLSGSAMQFINNGKPIDEKTPFDASSPYSISRIHSVYAARYYRKAFGIKVYVGFFFNHDSPFRTSRHINKKITESVLKIADGSFEKLEIGNLNVQKEFNFAGDIVEAVWILVNQDEIFEAVIGCGKTYSIKDWIEYCFKKINKDWKYFVDLKQDYHAEYDTLVSNPRLIFSLGWKPKVNIYELADMMLEQK